MNKNVGASPFQKIAAQSATPSPIAENLISKIDPSAKAAAPTEKKRSKGRLLSVSRTFYLEPEVVEELTRLNQEEGLNLSFFVNKAVKNALGL